MRRVLPGLLIATSACRIGFDPLAGERIITVTIEGEGAVASEPAGLACFGSCAARFDGVVALRSHPLDGWQLASWSPTCGDAPTCVLDDPAITAITVRFERAAITANRVFVTRAQMNGDLGGRAGADLLCRDTAVGAGVTGTFRAFLSTSSQAAIDVLVGSRGWVRLDGAPVFDTIADLTSGRHPFPIVLDENSLPYSERVWTGSNADGTAAGQMCNDWTASTGATGIQGFSSQVGADAIDDQGDVACDQLRSLYCFEVGRTLAPPAVARVPIGRYIFTTESAFSLGPNGLARADALCAHEAAAAGLPGEYTAMLATSTESIRDRLGDLSGPWRRPDDVIVAVDELGATGLLRVPFLVSAGGAAVIDQVFLGADDLISRGTQTCGDWEVTSGNARAGSNDNTDLAHMFTRTQPCSSARRLACLQR